MRDPTALLTPRRAANEGNDDAQDQIGSTSSTPPGATTPRPDPTDKRLPGILHSYFGQVRDSLMPARKSSTNPLSAAPSESSEKEGASETRPKMLPSPTPSASSRTPSTSQLAGEAEKLTQGEFAPLQYQATPPQTPRTHSQESKPLPSNLSRTSNASDQSKESTKSTKAAPVVAPKGKLAVTISEGRGLRPSVDPYVVCQFQWAEYISDGPRHDEAKKGRHAPMQMRRTESEMGRPMAIPMKSRQSSNSGHSSDARETASLDEVTSPKWEHDALL